LIEVSHNVGKQAIHAEASVHVDLFHHKSNCTFDKVADMNFILHSLAVMRIPRHSRTGFGWLIAISTTKRKT
jgi:hypothetical protein